MNINNDRSYIGHTEGNNLTN